MAAPAGRGWSPSPSLPVAASWSAAFSILAQMLIGFTDGGRTPPAGPRCSASSRSRTVQPRQPRPRLVSRVGRAASGGTTDELAIRGDCDALYLDTGDTYEPWVPVEHRSMRLGHHRSPGHPARADVRLGRIGTTSPATLWLQTDTRRARPRSCSATEDGVYDGPWFDVLPPGEIRLGVRDRPDVGYAEVGSTPGGFVGFLRSFDYDESWVGASGRRRRAHQPGDGWPRRGIRRRVRARPRPPAVRTSALPARERAPRCGSPS